MAGWHHRLDGRDSEWTLGVGDGQGGLACCDSWGRKDSDKTERLNWTELKFKDKFEDINVAKFFLIWDHTGVLSLWQQTSRTHVTDLCPGSQFESQDVRLQWGTDWSLHNSASSRLCCPKLRTPTMKPSAYYLSWLLCQVPMTNWYNMVYCFKCI